jgi:sulfite reductase (ferredoxin)
MKASNPLWKAHLAGHLPPDLAEEIDVFETELALRRQDKLEERVFSETRLRRGVYGQRYDNGQRYDGVRVQTLAYPAGTVSKGPNTLWDAPGMQRIKVPFGGLDAAQLETLAELAEEYSDGIAHVTTRQDFQLHFVHVENTPALMRRLATVGITTREACGNSVRNVTACPYAGVCADEPFDVSPYARALSRFLLGHPDCQEFGRKFKPAFSGCAQHACGLTAMHDLGAVAVTRGENGTPVRGFALSVGGGLGAVPHPAKLLEPFLPPEELLPTAQAIARVFARLGEKKNRNRARLKFLVDDLGIDAFRRLVREERAVLPHDPRWVDLVRAAEGERESPLRPPGEVPAQAAADPAFTRWLASNVRPQAQAGYAVATVTLPLGDITAGQLRALADVARRYTHETVRTTVEQNIVLRWVSRADLPALHAELRAAGLGQPGAGGIVDVVACPGTDTCKLGISASRGLAAELRKRLEESAFRMDAVVRDLHIKVSGCFNSCGQHHIADLGFYGVSRKLGGRAVPHFQVVLGGEWTRNAGAFGLPILAIPSRRIPQAVTRIADLFLADRREGERFQDFVKRVGKARIKDALADLAALPAPEAADAELFRDWGDARAYSTGDIGVGECAGEVVSAVEFGLAAAERSVFEAQLALEEGQAADAARRAQGAMLRAAGSLLRIEMEAVPEQAETVVAEFRTRFYDTQKFFDRFAGGKFAHYLFAAAKRAPESYSAESAHHLIEEAQLFIESAHGCYSRLSA